MADENTTENDSQLRPEELSLSDGFSNDPEVRQRWFSGLTVPNIQYNPDEMEFVQTAGRGDSGKVLVLKKESQQVAVKMIKPKRDKAKTARIVKREYAGLLLSNQLCPEVFPKPYGQLIDKRGNVVGLVMNLIEGKLLSSYFDREAYEKKKSIVVRKGVFLPDSFFEKIREAVNRLHEHNLWLTDWNGGKILVDEEERPYIVDVQYYPRPMTEDDKLIDNEAIEEIRKHFV